MKLALASIRTDGGTQPRAELSADAVNAYREEMEAGAKFPALVVFHDGETHWLADGFHRFHAAKALGVAKIDVEVRQGTQREAVLFSVGANATHGIPRTNADKRRAVECLLRDEEWGAKSDRWIAKACAVGNVLVSRLRADASTVSGKQLPASTVGQDGKTRKRPESKPAEPPAPIDAKASESADPVVAVVALKPEGAGAFVRPAPALAPPAPKVDPAGPAANESKEASEEAAPEPPAIEWTEEEAMRRITKAMGPIEEIVGSWPQGRSYRYLIDCLRNLANRCERFEQRRSA